MTPIKSLKSLMETLHNEILCREYLELIRWQGVPKCPKCDSKSDKHYQLKNRGEFNGLYKCRDCKKRFTVTIGTMFEGSNIPLKSWFMAIYMFLSHKKGISSIQLAKDIGVTQKTAWNMLTKIRSNLNETESLFIDKFDGEVQMDETYIGGKSKGRIWQNTGRSLKQKIPVVGMWTKYKAYAIVVPNTNGKTLKTIIYEMIKPGSIVITDGWKGYQGISNDYDHKVVEHSKGSYKNKEGFHTNGIEGFWSQLKRGLIGIYHSVSRKYLQFYCNEFTYRYNTRKDTDTDRFINFLKSNHKRYVLKI
jgi:transposase-like protein